MAPPKITLYLDIVSPFAYMGFHVLENHPLFKQCKITYIPIFLGGVMQKTGNTPPIKILNKDKYTEAERHRWATKYSVPMLSAMPEGFPANTITVQRVLCAIQRDHPEKLTPAFAALYQAFWVEGKAIQKPAVVAEALAGVLGKQDVESVMGKAGEAGIKQALIVNTDLAIKEGAFGLPWFVATNAEGKTEGFWGMDHLGVVVEHLGLDGQKDAEAFRSKL